MQIVTSNTEEKVKHTLKDGVFRHIFKEAENFVQMYEVFTGIKLHPEEITFKDTSSILLAKDRNNDISFLKNDGTFIILVEHQSTQNPNMALRMLIYYAELLKMHIKKHSLNVYGTAPIKYPKAELFVAYNGEKPWLKIEPVTAGDITINVKLVDIKFNKLPIKESSNTLSGYAYLMQQFYDYKQNDPLRVVEALEKALEDCRKAGYLLNFVNEEVFMTMLTEHWTAEQQLIDHERWAREEEQAKAEEQERKAREEEQAKAKEQERKAREEEQAKAQAKAEIEKLEIAKKFLSSGISPEVVAENCKLSLEIVNVLLKK